MHTISAGDKVLVTGANGFIAFWVVRRLLEKGYAVRGSVRSADKGKFLQESFKSYGDKFEIVVVEDMTEEGAFDKAVQGVDGIAHTATPTQLGTTSVEGITGPAVDGTVTVLRSAVKSGRGIKRVVVTSSIVAVAESGKDKIFTDKDWNELAVKEVKEQGENTPPFVAYCAAKTLAEKAAWAFYEKSKPDIKWDLSCVLPPFVFGPVIHDVKSLENLSGTIGLWRDTVLGGGQPEEFLTTQGGIWVDVRDIAEVHVLALEKEAAGEERIIISGGKPWSFIWQDWLDTANSLSPSPIPSHAPLPKGYPGAGLTAKPPVRFDTSKAQKILGLKYRTKEETTRDVLADFARRGW